ncbi:hypothetical protein NCCP2716_01530 [Sporosarcina sp. NCCP-2716]|uniref:hypothetical protein n=1 Tax=Sporosarcina sp. NCCP-2716 TaxID=2943679 RepID=UPI00203EF627|nr:hypothetical protein [Sporosarcina sp. NCCP-2716]GKV67655.1 hypothetical protein NCCP2716_01530 [Sporosarcina sp. NCCP-2716]
MGEKMTFYFDPEDRHWNNMLKAALEGRTPPVRDGEKRVFLFHKETVIEWDEMANHCICCMEPLLYNEQFDSVFCGACDEWREASCNDPECEYCGDRPARPSLCLDAEN